MDTQKATVRTLELPRGGVANVPVAAIVQNEVAGYNSGIEDFVDWIAEIDHFFEYMDIPQEKKMKPVACRLKGRAFGWWERLLQIRQREDFMRLAKRNDLWKGEVHQVTHYLDGLKLQIRDRTRVQVLKSVTEAKNLAIKVELMIRDRGGSRFEGNR
ncbi:hypothetical protein M9H77_23747 [Catharanthus roseus]|uniref:Uncharacterized protein n=1 Tax=Catharanthus roseus TaxID=4058 RepID=A0ACC0AWB5_CATRO|nr:hypothetical protein M9H77_23747 [Catharanthus roseus]